MFSLFCSSLYFTSCQKDDSLGTSDLQLSSRDPQSFSYSQNPAQVGDSVIIVFDLGNDADCGHVQVQVSGPDGSGWENGGKPMTPDSGMVSVLFIPEQPGWYLVRAKYTRTGKPSSCPYENTGWLVASDTLFVEGDPDMADSTACEALFTGEAISCDSSREAVFTFVAAEDIEHLKIQGGLTNGVIGDVEVTVDGADLDIYQKTPGHSTNRVITLEGSAVACDTITITLVWTSGNPGPVITGEWSASGGGIHLETEALECP